MEAGELMIKHDANQINGGALAYMGDAVYEIYVRKHVLQAGYTNPNILHKASVNYVEAAGQAAVIHEWLNRDGYLTDQEISIFKRGRNHKGGSVAKNASIGDYRLATGFEALFGWLYLSEQYDRLNELAEDAMHLIDERRAQDEKK